MDQISDLKKMYLESGSCKDIPYTQNCFRKFTAYEEAYGIELCGFSKEQILEIYLNINSKSAGTLRRINTYIKQYTQWCIDSGLFKGDNIYSKITMSDYDKCILSKDTYYKPENIDEFIKKLNNIEDAFILLALYEGLIDDDYHTILNLKVTDIDIKNCQIICDGDKGVTVSKKLILLAVMASQAEVYYVDNNLEKGEGLKDSDYLIKRVYCDRDANLIYRRMVWIRNYIGDRTLSIPKIIRSGFINNSIEISKKKGIKLLEFYKTPECQELKNRYHIDGYQKAKLNELFKRYLDI